MFSFSRQRQAEKSPADYLLEKIKALKNTSKSTIKFQHVVFEGLEESEKADKIREAVAELIYANSALESLTLSIDFMCDSRAIRTLSVYTETNHGDTEIKIRLTNGDISMRGGEFSMPGFFEVEVDDENGDPVLSKVVATFNLKKIREEKRLAFLQASHTKNAENAESKECALHGVFFKSELSEPKLMGEIFKFLEPAKPKQVKNAAPKRPLEEDAPRGDQAKKDEEKKDDAPQGNQAKKEEEQNDAAEESRIKRARR